MTGRSRVTSIARSSPPSSRSRIGDARIVLPAIVVGAIGQAALVTVDPIPRADGAFPLLFAASLVLAVLELAAIAVGTGARVDGDEPGPLLTRIVAAVLVSALGIILILAIAAFSPPVALLVTAIALPPLAAIATGRSIGDRFDRLRRRPAHTALWSAIAVVLGLAVAAASYALGLFIAGLVAAFLTWVLVGSSVALVLRGASRATERSR